MALYNEILVGRFNRALQKLFGMKGGAPSRQLSSEISVNVEFPLGVEFRYLETWDRFSIALNIGPVAAQNGAIRFRNPANSNVVAVIEKLTVFQQTGAAPLQINLERSNVVTADLASIANRVLQRLDPRGRDSYSITLSSANNVASIGVNHFAGSMAPLGATFEFIFNEHQEITVLPGDTAQLTSQTVNIGYGAC